MSFPNYYTIILSLFLMLLLYRVSLFLGSILCGSGRDYAPDIGSFYHYRRVRPRVSMGIATHQRTVRWGKLRGLRMGSVVHDEICPPLRIRWRSSTPEKPEKRNDDCSKN